MKYSAHAECEIIHFVNCEISPVAYGFGRCEMKFAHIREANISHLRSKYFTAELFHLPARANFVEKSTHLSVDKCVFFLVAPRGFCPLIRGRQTVVCEGNSLKKGNVAKRQKDGCPAKDCRRGKRLNLFYKYY